MATSADSAAPTRPALDLDDFFENGTVGLHLVGPDGTILKANPADYAPLGYSAEEYIGRNIMDFHADREVIDDILARLTRGERLERYPARLKAKDGSIRDVEISLERPLRLRRIRQHALLHRRRHRPETGRGGPARGGGEARRHLRERRRGHRRGRRRGSVPARQRGFCRLCGYGRDEIARLSFFDFTYPADAADERERWRALIAGEVERFTIEKRYVRSDGRIIWIEVMNSAVRGADGGFAYGVKMLLDITERREADARQRLLLDELNHRVKNTLATVQSLAAQTARGCGSVEEFRAHFEPRLLALSAAHDRLTRNQWEGRASGPSRRRSSCRPRRAGRTLSAEGPDVTCRRARACR